jgi:PAS domain S-box-containing protein
MLKNVKILFGPPEVAAAFGLALLPIPLLCVSAIVLRHNGVIGDLELALGLAVSLMAAFFSGTYWVLRVRPVSRQTHATDPLCCGEALFDIFMAHLPALAFLKDRQGRYLYVNSACRRMWQRSSETVIGRSDTDLWPEEIAGPLCQSDSHIIGSGEVFSTVERIMVGAEERYHLVTKFPVVSGKHLMLGGIAFDITDKVRAQEENARLEEQLIQSQKMEAVGTLAGGIAHDFNNVLSAIMGYVELAQMDANPAGEVQNDLAQVLKATHRAKDLVKQILTFSRKTGHDREPLDPKPLVKEALVLLRASIPSTIEIRQHVTDRGVYVLANATQFHQVIMNLCTNAAHAMEASGGILELTLQNVSITGATTSRQGVPPGRYLELRVRDTGPGISPALRERIFDPYFTTKAQGKGTGMGLSVVRSIVESHGGSIDVESRFGKGACFCVLLPATSRMARITSHRQNALPHGTEAILYVDDEPVLVDLGRQMLSRLGYRVTCCDNSFDALALVKDNPNRFDLVVTDTTMPAMTGDVLAGRLLDIRPDLPVILCTGYSEQVTHETASDLGISAFLMKPLAIGDLAFTLRSVLDSRPPGIPQPCLKAVPN